MSFRARYDSLFGGGDPKDIQQLTPELQDIYRTVRTQKFSWNDDGTPKFPLAENGPFPIPSGQNGQAAVNERSLSGRLDGFWQGNSKLTS